MAAAWFRAPSPHRVKRLGPSLIVVMVGVVVIATAGCANGSSDALLPCGGATTQRYAAHEGVAADLNSLDIWRPQSGDDGRCSNRPLVVWVHGGGWSEGDKTDDIDDKVALFTGAGYAFASINYRLTNRDANPPAPQHPVHDQDAADAIDWIVEHATELGIDRDRIALLGHSAGGGIVAAITTDAAYLGKHGLMLTTIRCAGSIDGEGYDVTVGATHPDPLVHDTYLSAFGSDPATWKSASPMTHIASDTGIPSYLVAARGPEMRLDLHLEFANALRAAKVPVTVLDAQTLDHATVSTNIGAPGDTVMTPAVMDFLDRCFEPR